MDNTLLEKVVAILAGARDMTIATIREDGFPQATTVSYVSDGLTIYFGCDPSSQKAKNIARNNKVSLTANLDYSDWNQIQGISMGGLGEPISDPEEIDKVGNLMLAKFPQVADFISDESGEIRFFRIEPIVVSVLDYSKGFGHTDLIEL